MKKLSIFAFLFSSLLSFGQGDQTLIQVPISATATETAIVHLPDDYSKTNTNYPLMIFFHGIGEAVTPSAIYNSSTAGGPAYFIAQGKFPSSFINPADGKSYKFIIVSPQAPNPGVSTLASQADYILSFLYKLYRVDTSRVCLTGLSAGGECALEYTTGIQGSGLPFLKTHKIATLIPMSAVMNASQRTAMAQYLVSNKIGVWGFGSPTDTHGANTIGLTDWDINHQIQAGYAITTSYSGGHCCWGQFYNPSFTQNGMNIYQWALQYSTGATSPPVIIPPVVKPTVDSAGIIKAYLATHPCPVCPVADSAGIIKAYVSGHPCPICPVCPPPIVCPVCPVIPPQRTAVKIISDLVTGVSSILYSDGTTLALPK